MVKRQNKILKKRPDDRRGAFSFGKILIQ